MKIRPIVHLTAALTVVFAASAQAEQHHLRYEWSAGPAGPFTLVPREMIRVHADGTATVVSPEPRGAAAPV